MILSIEMGIRGIPCGGGGNALVAICAAFGDEENEDKTSLDLLCGFVHSYDIPSYFLFHFCFHFVKVLRR